MTDTDRVYVRFRGRTLGPLTPDKVKDLIKRGQVTRMHELSGDGITWSKADEFGDFFPPLQPAGFGQFPGEAMGGPGMGGMGAPGMGGMAPGAVPPAPGGGPPMPPGAGGPPAMGASANPAHTSAQWFAHVKDNNEGPISYDQLQLWAHAKVLKPDSLVWNSSMESWKPAQEIMPELFSALGPTSQDEEEEEEDTIARGDIVEITLELSKQSGWIIGLAVALFAFAIVLFVGQSVPLINPRLGTQTIEFMRPLLGLILGALLIGIGVMLLLYNGKVKQLVNEPNMANTHAATEALSHVWAVVGIGGVVWVTLLVLLLVYAGLTGFDVLRLIR